MSERPRSVTVTECRHCETPVVYSAFHMQWLGPDGTAWCSDGRDHDGARAVGAMA